MKKNYRFITCLLIVLAMLFALCGCGSNEPEKTGGSPSGLTDAVTIGTLNGPTGMGLIDLRDAENVELQQYQAPDEVVQKLISGDIDVACLPSNMGAVLNVKTEGNVVVLTTIVNGVLYLVENCGEYEGQVHSFEDLAGKTVFASGKGGTPEYVLQALLEDAGLTIGEDVQIEWLDVHADVAQKLLATEGSVALLPEPFVSNVVSKSESAEIALNLNNEWMRMTGHELPMGILLAKKDFVENRSADAEALLAMADASIKDVRSASDEVVKKLVDAGFVENEVLCASVIPNLSLTCMSADESRETLSAFYAKLFESAPASVGGSLPGDELFWKEPLQ